MSDPTTTTTTATPILVHVLGFLSCSLTVMMFATPLQLARELQQQQQHNNNNNNNYSPVPYAAMLVNALLWTAYGLVTERLPIVLCNVVGVMCGAYVLSVFATTCSSSSSTSLSDATRTSLVRCVIGICLSLSLVLASLWQQTEGKEFERRLGWAGNIAACCMFCGPLLTKHSSSSSSSSRNQNLVNLATALSWCLYGLTLRDAFVVAPNAFGVAVGCVSIVRYVRNSGESTGVV
eukprot:PhM_4_TR16128/c1_g1_i1/m.31944/K15382/SLC50A, SWEET; solute carrier family 50 (sugar transporter)